MAKTRTDSGDVQPQLDFSVSIGERSKKAKQLQQPLTFVDTVDLDVHLLSSDEIVVDIAGSYPDSSIAWLGKLTGSIRHIRRRRVAVPVALVDRLLYVRPPAKITLDASALAVGRAIWADKLGLKPIHVRRSRGRLLASSSGWPAGMTVKDAPWPAIAAIESLGLSLNVDDSAKVLLLEKLAVANQTIATAGLAGSAVIFKARRSDLLEALGLPALAYAGPKDTGLYRMPLLASECLLGEPTIKLSNDLKRAIKTVTSRPKPLEPAEGFPWTLYPFQARDAARAMRILDTAGGVLLAGDMGSGKTTVALAVAHQMDMWPLLVVAPLAAFSTWQRQLEQMGRKVIFTNGTMSDTWALLQEGDFDAAVVSYDRLHALVEVLEQLDFKAIIADEIQRIRTPGSRRSRALRALSGSTPYRIGLSGTPLQNRATDLLPLGAFLVPGEWRPRGANDLSDIYPAKDGTDALATHLGSLMVRRKMVDTGVSLPGKNVHRLHVTLSPEQHRALEELRLEATEERDTTGYTTSDRMHVFTRLQKMRQIISCPQMADVTGPNPKVKGAVDLAEEYVDQGRKGIIFCVYRQTWREIGDSLKKAGMGWAGIWGSSSLQDRLDAEARFHSDPDTKVFIGTLAACSEALTLSPTATFCIFTDLSYSPSDLAQAEARAYRMNTVEPVDVIYMHATAPGGTVDDRMVELLAIKQELFAKVIDGESTWHDPAKVHYSLDDLVYLVTGEHGLSKTPTLTMPSGAAGTAKRKADVSPKSIEPAVAPALGAAGTAAPARHPSNTETIDALEEAGLGDDVIDEHDDYDLLDFDQADLDLG